ALEVISLAAQAELLDQSLIAALVGLLQVIQERPARGHELEQPATRVVVLLVGLEVFRQVRDALRHDRHLHLGAAGIGFAAGVVADYVSFTLGGNRHRASSRSFPDERPARARAGPRASRRAPRSHRPPWLKRFSSRG